MTIKEVLKKYESWEEKPFLFGMETMRITQNYKGSSHINHTLGTPKDYPIDIAGNNSERSAYFCPVEMKVTAIKGKVQNNISNTIWLVSTNKVLTPIGSFNVFMTLTHWNDNDTQIAKLKVGSIIPGGTIICYEGTDSANANHLHVVYGIDSSDNWIKNNKGSWVITGNTKKPEEICYIDTDFTNVVNTGGIDFKKVPTENPNKKRMVGTPISVIQILEKNVNCRDNAGKSAKILGYIKPGFYHYKSNKNIDGYDWYEVEPNMWVAHDESWSKLY